MAPANAPSAIHAQILSFCPMLPLQVIQINESAPPSQNWGQTYKIALSPQSCKESLEAGAKTSSFEGLQHTLLAARLRPSPLNNSA